jgi:hypothetical protein
MWIIRYVRGFFARPLSLPAMLTIFGFVIVLFLTAIALSIVSWHTTPLTMADMVGTYTLDYKTDYGYLGKETLILKADGTYTQIYISVKGPTVKNNGNWDLHPIMGEQMFALYDYMLPMDEFGKPNKIPFPKTGAVSSTPYKFMGKVVIPGDPNFDQYYHKIK